MSERTALYRLYDADKTLLYVGVTDAPSARWIQHSRDKPWWPEVAMKEVEWYSSRREALSAESAAISAEAPAYNVMGAPGRRRDVLERRAIKLGICDGFPVMRWWEYVVSVSGGATQTAIADRTGVTQSSINRWRTTQPKSDNVVSFARAYGRPVLEAFVAAGFLTAEDAGLTHAPLILSDIPIEDLLTEVHRRVTG